MSLLPKTFHDFSSKQYWNTFFSKRGEKAFEWYGEYAELCGLLHKYIRPSDNILVAGCGNSTLSADLYRVGYRKLTNVDNSEVVIRQMRDKHKSDCPDMVWLRTDLTAMDVADGGFSVVLDKAALDALMTDDSPSVVEFVDKYFREVSRVLRVGGRFVCVSLLQEHILQHILKWFPADGWMVRVCRCEDAEKSQSESGKFSFPVFVVVCTKFKQMPNFKPVIEVQFDGETAQRVEAASEVVERVRELQQYALLRHTLHTKSVVGESTSVQLCDPSDGTLRYTLYVVDSKDSSRPVKFAVFIVPLGREREWLFGSVKGREELSKSAGVVRLLVAHLHHHHHHDDTTTTTTTAPPRTLKQIQDELSAKVMELAPSRLPANTKVPFLSVGEEVGEVEVVARGTSQHAGAYVVEDTHPPGAQPIRRLIFLNNQAVVQSEARILRENQNRKEKEKEKRKKKKGGKKNTQPQRPQQPPSTTLDHSYLSCQHHAAMVGGLAMAPRTDPILLLGLGGGPLATFIHNNFTEAALTAVELDSAMVEVARQWFGFTPDDRLKVEVCDGLDYVERMAQEGHKFGAILFDVDSKDSSEGMSCPPAAFVEPMFLQRVAQCLSEGGLLILNLVCRDEELRAKTITTIKSAFPTVLQQDIPGEVNCILHCLLAPPGEAEGLRGRFEGKVKGLNVRLSRRYEKEEEEDVWELAEMVKGLRVV
ncbi:eEF1A lysine and N-terminal methyltransferase-like [Eriocheir sinensis]|uniref:eEF1A lysine and N-terminal methyltransferase-like n=1 Tax=Eriocheir sinensis TaxID=95602 RepID=UPI0021C79AFB|nr:eEF1A lysine and N-terminal methyltransferase-like [Eriocheir sinensis]